MREAMGNRTGGRLRRAGAVTLLMLAGSLAAPTQAATILAQHGYRVVTDLNELVAEFYDYISWPDYFVEAVYQLAPSDPDYVRAGGAAGDRYARAGSSAGIGTASGYGRLLLEGWGAGVWVDHGTAGGTGTADVTVLFRGAVGFDDPHPLSERAVCGGTSSCESPNWLTFFWLNSYAFLTLLVDRDDTKEQWLLLANFFISRDVSGYEPLIDHARDFAAAAWQTSYYSPYSPDGRTEISSGYEEKYFDPEIGGLRSFWQEMNLALPVSFVEGGLYQISLQVECWSSAFGITNLLVDRGPASTFCQLGESGYLTGFTNFRDASGNPIAPFGLFARDGTNLALPSPFAPGGGPAPIPEPASWAMLIAGFGLVGSALRRRRVAEGAGI